MKRAAASCIRNYPVGQDEAPPPAAEEPVAGNANTEGHDGASGIRVFARDPGTMQARLLPEAPLEVAGPPACMSDIALPGSVTPEWLQEVGKALPETSPYIISTLRQVVAGEADAQYELACILISRGLMPRWHSQTLDLMERAAAQNLVKAEHALGCIYNFSGAVPGDFPKALAWFKSAASHGSVNALETLGLLYAEGKLVEKDPGKAFGYFSEAAANGGTDGSQYMASIYFKGSGVEQDLQKAMYWLCQAGDEDADLALWFHDESDLPREYCLNPDDINALLPFLSAEVNARKIARLTFLGTSIDAKGAEYIAEIIRNTATLEAVAFDCFTVLSSAAVDTILEAVWWNTRLQRVDIGAISRPNPGFSKYKTTELRRHLSRNIEISRLVEIYIQDVINLSSG